jgi:phospholipase/carboxylesterase
MPRDGRPAVSPFTRREFLASSAGVLLAPSLLGCEDDGVGPAPGDPHLTARPGDPTEVPEAGVSALGLDLGIGDRDGILYVPAGYSPDTPAPLFVALHGAGGRGSSWSGFYPAAENRSMILLAPDSRSGTWDLVARAAFGPDVDFLDRALAYTFARCRIDPSRIALGGFSDGASYALSLGVSNGDLFTHLVAYSPGFYLHGDRSPAKPRIFVSHGTRDPILPFSTTRDRIVPQLRDAGYDVTFQEFDGGHEVPSAIGSAGLDWMGA